MTTAHGEPTDRMPTGRFEWERIVRRAMLPEPVKYLAFVLATYADPDGSRVRPGLPVLAAVTGKAVRTVRRLLAELVDHGLIELVSRGGGRGHNGRASVYRLTLPTDLLDRVELLPPSERVIQTAATQMATQSPETPATQMAAHCGQTPVDNSETVATLVAAQSVAAEPIEWPLGDSFGRLSGQSGPIERPCRETLYHPHTPTTKEDHPGSSDPAHPQTARTDRSQEDHGEPVEETAAEPPARCAHNLAIRVRDDGQPGCAFCRRDAARSPT